DDPYPLFDNSLNHDLLTGVLHPLSVNQSPAPPAAPPPGGPVAGCNVGSGPGQLTKSHGVAVASVLGARNVQDQFMTGAAGGVLPSTAVPPHYYDMDLIDVCSGTKFSMSLIYGALEQFANRYDVVNLSLDTDPHPGPADESGYAIELARSPKTLFVVAAGNE